MISLAAGGGDYTFLVIMLVVGLINWIVSKVKGAAAPPPKPRRPVAPSPRSQESDSDESEGERMRRFMEALGIPSDEPAPKPAPRLAPAPSVEVRRTIAPPPLPPRRELVSWDEAEAPTLPVERITLRELEVPVVEEFATVSSRVSAIPVGNFQYSASTEEPAVASRISGATMPELLATLRPGDALRRSFVLREILGPPRGLQ